MHDKLNLLLLTLEIRMKTQKTLSLTVDKSVDKGKEISCLKV